MNECALFEMIVATQNDQEDNRLSEKKKKSACHLHKLKSKLIIIIIYRLLWNIAAARNVTTSYWGREIISLEP